MRAGLLLQVDTSVLLRPILFRLPTGALNLCIATRKRLSIMRFIVIFVTLLL